MIVKRFFFNFSNNIVKKISGKKNLDTDTSCPRCNYPKETINHIFECLFALHRVELYQTIHLSGFFPNKSVYQNIDIYSVLEKKDVVYSKLLIDTFSQILWYIQKERNRKVFNENMFNRSFKKKKICLTFRHLPSSLVRGGMLKKLTFQKTKRKMIHHQFLPLF